MPDTTYKESVIEQIRGSSQIADGDKKELVKYVRKLDENKSKGLTQGRNNRFFYRSSQQDVETKIVENLKPGQRRYLQLQANKAAARGETDTFAQRHFKTTYTRGGHKYVDGVRQY